MSTSPQDPNGSERAASGDNPLLGNWNTPYGAPPFAAIEPSHFLPAFAQAMQRHLAEIDAICASPEAPTFDNTIAALERGGRALRRVSATFFNLAGAHANEALQAIEREIAPKLARHRNMIQANETLFRRIEALHAQGGLGLSDEQRRVIDRYHTIFVRAGAALEQDAKRRLAHIVERLATLGTAFSQNVLKDEQSYALVLETEADLVGLPDFVRHAAARAAEERGLQGKHAITLARSSIEPFLQFSERRDLRERAFKAWIARGDSGGATDNKEIIKETVALRAERARLLGYPTYAHFKLDDAMAKTPEAVEELLMAVWESARERALRERDDLQAMVARSGGNYPLAAWDWRYFAEKVRKERYDFDESAIKPYLQLDKMIEAAFSVAQRLFGLSFAERRDAPVYHPDVRVWEVTGRDGRHVGVFMGDYFARPSKRSGAWKSAFRVQENMDAEVRPIVVNVMNFSKGGEGEPALLSFDDARTLFHEFGHALHGLLSDVTYPLISGTSVASDFVELPSQLYEHWLSQPEVLSRFAVHARTGEPLPAAMIERLREARTFNQGFATVEYVASAAVDLDYHMLTGPDTFDVTAVERDSLARIGMPPEIVMRHRSPHFAHVFSGDAYSAGYYSYLWSEVMDADAFRAFEETGEIFNESVATRLHDYIYSAGNKRDAADAYRAFRGGLPSIDALLEKRGLAERAGGGAGPVPSAEG